MKAFYFFPILMLWNNILSYGQENIPVGRIETNLGEIFISFHEQTPQHKAHFIELANAGYWDSLTFNRVIPEFVAQGGCPDTEAGFTDPTYLLEPEFDSSLRHVYGAVGAGRDDNPGKLSATCQFYIVQNRNGLHRLDGDYTVFGQVIKGMEIIEKIVYSERNNQDEPLQPITLKISIQMIDKEALKKISERNEL
jgi:peptidyl-prolyl cis-trans isomerase B (cyclophilin B)